MGEVQIHEGTSTTDIVADNLSDVLAKAAEDVKGKYIAEVAVFVDTSATNIETNKHPWVFRYMSLREGRI